jgi:predicted ATPase
MLKTAWNAALEWANCAQYLNRSAASWDVLAYLCVVLAAVCGPLAWLVVWRLPGEWDLSAAWLAPAGVASAAIGAYICLLIGGRRWADAQQAIATAERVRSECYRFAAKTERYAGAEPGARAFQRLIALLEKQAIDKGILRLGFPAPPPADQREPTAQNMTAEWYRTERIRDQIEYLRQARMEKEVLAIRFWGVVFVFGLATVLLGALAAFLALTIALGGHALWGESLATLLAAITTALASFVAWHEVKLCRRNIFRYAAVQSDLEHVLGLDESEPALLVDLVAKTEGLLEPLWEAVQLPIDKYDPATPPGVATTEDTPQSTTVVQQTYPEPQPRPAQQQAPLVSSPPTLNIGLSFTAEDRPVAQALGNVLLTLDSKIKVLMRSEFPAGARWQDQITKMLDDADILIPTSTMTMQSPSGGYTGFEIGYFFQSLRTVPKMRDFPDQDRRILMFRVFAAVPEGTGQNQDERFSERSLAGFEEIRVDIDTTVPPASSEFEQRNERNTEVISAFLQEILRIVQGHHYGGPRPGLELPRPALDLCRKLFDVMQAKQTESHREVERVKEERAIAEERYLERNLKDVFLVQSFSWYGLSFLEDGQYIFSPRVNVLLGKNGYGKTLLLRTFAALLQRDAEHSNLVTRDGKADGLRLTVNVIRNKRTETISRDATYFLDSVGKIPLLAIPDSRFINRTQLTVAGSALASEPLERSGARNFLTQEPYENAVQDLLTQLGLDYMEASSSDENQRFDRPIFRLVERVVAELTEDRDFKFAEVKRVEKRFQILVYTAGATKDPIPIQSASQGTLSVVAMFGLIYSFLRALRRDIAETEVLNASAIVLIDEIDAHLHPSWQQKLLLILTRTFPNVQFIVSAHSPFIVAGCDQGEVSVLRRRRETGGFFIDTLAEDFLGVTSRDLYKRVFEIDEVDRLYVEYLPKTQVPSEDHAGEIETLERKPSRSPEEEQRLSFLFREARLIERARNASDERLKMERQGAVIARLETEVEFLRATVEEQEAVAKRAQHIAAKQA